MCLKRTDIQLVVGQIHGDAFLHFYLICKSGFGVGQLLCLRAFFGPATVKQSIHKNPSSLLASSCTQGLLLEPFPAVTGWRPGDTLDSRQFNALKQTTIHTHTIPTAYKQHGLPNSLHMCLVCGRKPESHSENSSLQGPRFGDRTRDLLSARQQR